MKLWLKSSWLCNEKTWRMTFFAVHHRSVFVPQIGLQLHIWRRRLDFETPCDLTWTITHVEWSFYWPVGSHLPCGACCVFGGDRLWRGPEPSFVLVLLVPVSWALFAKEWGRGVGLGGVLPFWTAVQTQLAGAWEEWAVGRQRPYRRSAGSPDRSSAPSAQTVWRVPGGRGWWAGGGERWWDVAIGRTADYRQFHFACFNNIKTSVTELALFRNANICIYFNNSYLTQLTLDQT